MKCKVEDKRYTVIEKVDVGTLMEEVNNLLAKGWVLAGGISMVVKMMRIPYSRIRYAQALIKTTVELVDDEK